MLEEQSSIGKFRFRYWCHRILNQHSYVFFLVPSHQFHSSVQFHPLLILFHYNKHFEIHKSPGSPEILFIQLISAPFLHVTFLVRNAAARPPPCRPPPTSRLFQNSCGNLYFPCKWTQATNIPIQDTWYSYSLAGRSLLVSQVLLKSNSDY